MFFSIVNFPDFIIAKKYFLNVKLRNNINNSSMGNESLVMIKDAIFKHLGAIPYKRWFTCIILDHSHRISWENGFI